MSGLLDKWLSPHGCGKAATPANAATLSGKPAQTLAEMGSNRSATFCYPEPESVEGSNGVATTLLPKIASKHAASAAEVAKVAGVAGYRHPCPEMAPKPGSTVARIIEAGGTSWIGGDGKRLHREAVLPAEAALTNAPYCGAALPAGAVAELIAELEDDGWHVLRTIEAAERATPRPDLDPAEWQGEYEDALPHPAA